MLTGKKSHVFGTITTTGHFEGQIQLHNDSFVIEKASRHNITDEDIHTVIYNVKDVNIPKESHFFAGYNYSGNHGVNSMLFLNSEENYDQFCLSYIFTHRDFDNGILGLAWTAEPGTSGGLCSRYTLYTDGRLSLNTGIVTDLNYRNDVTTAVSYVTFAHEIGHNFGSLHGESSNPTCAPCGSSGNYIMFAQATAGTKSNNILFSSCSISSMATMVATRGRNTANGCFVEYSSPTCGNKVVESGEDYDCGWDDDCTDTCCYPTLSATGSDSAKACHPSEGVCCNPKTCSNYPSSINKCVGPTLLVLMKQSVDPSGLKNFFLNGEIIDKVKEFLTEYWYVAIARGVGLIILLCK
ncbi:disintegrin and metalloproteinase domain-containing protein 10-like [Mytilus galloprovincialis]|uniref:disintegrin and metalloproteinase domain-containing protein 10-like n=1 Tax=Mytilus galloprovincialis TaxID=29158 RepID=UPI003F7B6AC1